MNDALVGALVLAFGVILVLWARQFPAIPGQEYGADVFPTLVGAGFVGCGVLLGLGGFRQHAPLVAWADWARERHGMRNVLVTSGAVLFYLVAAEWVGFHLAMMPLLVVLFRLFDVGWPMTLVTALGVTLGLHALFQGQLLVPLPRGELRYMLGW